MPNFYINFLNKTVKSLSILYDFAVASLMGAWIKTLGTVHRRKIGIESHPSRVRGLKHCITIRNERPMIVAPLTGAWIKIMEQKQRFMLRSHSSWMRGLKPYGS